MQLHGLFKSLQVNFYWADERESSPWRESSCLLFSLLDIIISGHVASAVYRKRRSADNTSLHNQFLSTCGHLNNGVSVWMVWMFWPMLRGRSYCIITTVVIHSCSPTLHRAEAENTPLLIKSGMLGQIPSCTSEGEYADQHQADVLLKGYL